MLTYRPGSLSAPAAAALTRLQAAVDTQPDHRARVGAARRMFGRAERRTFQEVRERLAAVSPPGRACYYCERDRFRDIDHIRPLRHYPEQAFDWSNYVYACTICNQDRKRDRYAVIDGAGNLKAFDRSWPIDAPVPTGLQALIDVRREDPLDFLILDFETGRFEPVGDDRQRIQRAAFTCGLFGLNNDDLARARQHARRAFRHYLELHLQALAADRLDKAERIIEEIKELPQPTVLVEMRRQRDHHPWLPELIDPLPPELGLRTTAARGLFD